MRRALLALVVLVVLLGACDVRTEVAVDVAGDGSGTVAVAVGLDADAVERAGDLSSILRLDDLTAAGWSVSGPALEDDGLTWVRATKPFASVEGAIAVLAELGPLRDVSLERERGFARTTTRFSAVVDLSGGLESFGDSELTAALEGEPLGEDAAAIEARIGQPLDEAFTMTVVVRLPGDREVAATPVLGGDPVEVTLTSEVVRTRTYVLAGVAVLAVLAALLVATGFPWQGRRARRAVKPRGRHAAPS